MFIDSDMYCPLSRNEAEEMVQILMELLDDPMTPWYE